MSRLRQPWGQAALAGCLFCVLLGFAALSFRLPFHYQMPQNRPLGFAIDGVGPTEAGERGWFRWFAPYTALQLPAAGHTSYRLQITFHSPAQPEARSLQVRSGDQLLTRTTLRAGWQSLNVILPATSTAPELILETTPPLEQANRSLGIAVSDLQLAPIAPASLPLVVLGQLLGCVALVAACALVCGASWRTTLWISNMALAVSLASLAAWRINTLLVLPPLWRALAAGLVLGGLLRLGGTRWLTAADRHWLHAVRGLVVALFVLRTVGMWYPQFQEIDHLLRVHQIEKIAEGRGAEVAASLANQYEWGSQVIVPYSLWGYYPFVPLAAVFATAPLRLAVEGITAALEASIPLALFGLVLRAGGSARRGCWIAATYAAFPIGFLYYHDGSFPTIMGLWIVVLTLGCVQQLAKTPGWRWAILSVIGVMFSLLIYVTHLAFVPLLLGAYCVSLWFGSPDERRVARWTAATLTIGLVLALGVYYGRVLPTLIRTTLPLLWQSLGGQGTVGGEGSALPSALIGPVWAQAWGHFRVIGLLLAAVGLLWIWRRESWLRHLAVAFAVFVVISVLVDTRFGLWNKHWYFALPGIALLAGYALAQIAERGPIGRWLARGMLGLLIAASLHAWLVRVLFYEWSLRTL